MVSFFSKKHTVKPLFRDTLWTNYQVSPEVSPEWRLGWGLLIINLGNLLLSLFQATR